MITKKNIVKFLKDYCYAIYLGLFGLYLANVWGMLVVGSIGLFYDYKIKKEKSHKEYIPKKETFLGSKKLHSKLNQLQDWKPVYKYLMWVVWSVALGYLCIFLVAIYDILYVFKGFVSENNNHNFLSMKKHYLTLRMSSTIPFINNYIFYLQNNGLEKASFFMANVFSFFWILCVIRVPGLLKHNHDFECLINKKITKAYLKVASTFVSFLLFCITFFFIYFGVEEFFPKNVGDGKITTFIFIFLIPTTWLMLALTIALLKNTINTYKTK